MPLCVFRTKLNGVTIRNQEFSQDAYYFILKHLRSNYISKKNYAFFGTHSIANGFFFFCLGCSHVFSPAVIYPSSYGCTSITFSSEFFHTGREGWCPVLHYYHTQTCLCINMLGKIVNLWPASSLKGKLLQWQCLRFYSSLHPEHLTSFSS